MSAQLPTTRSHSDYTRRRNQEIRRRDLIHALPKGSQDRKQALIQWRLEQDHVRICERGPKDDCPTWKLIPLCLIVESRLSKANFCARIEIEEGQLEDYISRNFVPAEQPRVVEKEDEAKEILA